MNKDYVKMVEEWLRPIWEWDAKENADNQIAEELIKNLPGRIL